MIEVEKYTPKRINLDDDPGGMHRDGDRIFIPGDLLDAFNCRYKGNGKRGKVHNIPGNSLVDYSLPAGENKTIGRILNERDNSTIFFNWNSEGNHRVLEYFHETKTFELLLQGSSLNFQQNKNIHGRVINGLCIFNDATDRIKCFDVVRARAGFYVAPYGEILTLAVVPPLVPPTTAIVTDNTISLNYISANTWQFAYRFRYIDNRESVFGPLSKLVWIRTEADMSNLTDNAIDVTITIPANLLPVIKECDIVYREGNTGNYYIFETIRNPNQTEYTARFKGNGKSTAVPLSQQTRLYDVISDRVESIEIIDSRAITTLNKVGFDVPDTFSLSVSVANEAKQDRKLYLKEGGRYGVGILYSDGYGKTTFVKDPQYISIPFTSHPFGDRSYIQWSLAGTPPPGMTKYQIVLSLNNFHETYMQCEVTPHLYVRDIRENEQDGTSTSDQYWWRAKLFLKLEEGVSGGDPNRGGPKYSYVYLQTPLNLPFIPDSTCLIRFYKDGIPKAIVPVVDVIGDFIVIDKLYSTPPNPLDPLRQPGVLYDWSGNASASGGYFIEIFKPLDFVEETFFEVGEVFDIENDQFTVSSGKVYADTYLVTAQHNYSPIVLEGNEITQQRLTSSPRSLVIESPSGITKQTTIGLPSPVYNEKRGDRTSGGREVTDEDTTTKKVYTFDYTKAAADYGRRHTIYSNEEARDLATSIGFSEQIVQDTNINGINAFNAANQYPIPVERSRIAALKKAGDVLLAIHERETTSVYIGEGVIRQGDDFILAKTDNVIGDDRRMKESYGCINPESILDVNSDIYWWDAYSGAVVRYTKAGLFPISIYGMYDYFYRKGQRMLPHKDQVKVVMGYDYNNFELMVTFHDVKNQSGTIVVPAETWVFNTRDNEWQERRAFIPEGYGVSKNDVFTFKAGKVWAHGANALYNNFYGVQYKRSLKFVSNPKLGKNKKILAVHLKGNITADYNSEEVVVRITTPQGQETFIPAYEFELNEGKYVAHVLKDIHTPAGEGQLALRSGDDIVSEYFIIEVINNRTDEGELTQINVVYKTEEFSI